jgi:two-component system sensor histidine kinase QseC
MKSLRVRLFVVLMLTIAALWCYWPVFIVQQAWRGETGWWDLSLRDTANQILASLPAELDSPATARAAQVPLPTWFQGEYQVWLDRRIVMRSPGAPVDALKADFVDGPAREQLGKDVWWVYAASSANRKIQVQVGRRHSQVEHDSRMLVNFSLLNTGLMLVIMGVAIWVVIRWSLRRVTALRTAVQKRNAFDLTPLSIEGLPNEVRPLVDSFNRLLEQLDRAVEGERRFIADAAHELRTPLAALSVDAQVALNAGDLEEKNAALLRLAAGVERSARLSEQLLDLARLDASKDATHRLPVDLSELTNIVLRDFETAAQRNKQLISVDTEPCFIDGNIDELGILLRNLIDNALRFTGAGGQIAVSCRHVQEGGMRRVRLKIADDGPGVPVADRDRIFERFYRVAGSGQRGSGIGLSLVSRIAQSHGASIHLGEGLQGRGLGISVLFEVSA